MEINSPNSSEPIQKKDIKFLLGALLVNILFLVALFLLF